MTTKPALTVKNLSITFPMGPTMAGPARALDDISFTIRPREFICFLGPSGSGKTTLLKVLAGLLQPTYGNVHFMHRHTQRSAWSFSKPASCPGAP
jgi:NitT/TauT family transport system ATP-binding protein